MANSTEIKEFDVIILGAGPGGCTSALTLRNSGLRVAMIDKSSFPRDKVCGELMARKTVVTLESVLPGFEKEFKNFEMTRVLKHTRVHFKGKVLQFDWVSESYTCPRIEFDNYMLNLVKSSTNTSVFTATVPDVLTRDADGVTLTIKNSNVVFKSKMLIGADGANSIVARQFADKTINRDHYLGSVRAYYSNIKDMDSTVSEVFFNTRFQFNYLWVFPVRGNQANVGFGMVSSDISKQKINLKDAFYEHFKLSPDLGDRFHDATQVTPLEGFGVPLGSSVGTTSGDRFVLVGDAASLSNPLSGTGMGNAVISGKLAAEQAMKCFKKNDFSGEHMKLYDDSIQKAIINDLMASFRMQKLISKMPFMLDIVFWLGKYDRVKKYIQSVA